MLRNFIDFVSAVCFLHMRNNGNWRGKFIEKVMEVTKGLGENLIIHDPHGFFLDYLMGDYFLEIRRRLREKRWWFEKLI